MLEREKQIKENKPMQIKPTPAVIAEWIANYIPEKNLFFLTAEQYKKINQIHYINSYEYWNIKRVQYVITAASNWIEQLSNVERKFILAAKCT